MSTWAEKIEEARAAWKIAGQRERRIAMAAAEAKIQSHLDNVNTTLAAAVDEGGLSLNAVAKLAGMNWAATRDAVERGRELRGYVAPAPAEDEVQKFRYDPDTHRLVVNLNGDWSEYRSAIWHTDEELAAAESAWTFTYQPAMGTFLPDDHDLPGVMDKPICVLMTTPHARKEAIDYIKGV